MHSPASERNKQPILEQLQTLLPARANILELACGSLQHARHFTSSNPGWRWHPTDIDACALSHATDLYATHSLPPNIAPAQYLNITETPWQPSVSHSTQDTPVSPTRDTPVLLGTEDMETEDTPLQFAAESNAQDTPLHFGVKSGGFDAVYTANLLHISSKDVLESLFMGARDALNEDGQVVIYGPFTLEGRHTSAGNQAFDADLKIRNAEWGIRDMAELRYAAKVSQFELKRQIDVPANNFLLVFAQIKPHN